MGTEASPSSAALVAVLLAAAGLYSSLSHWMGRRGRELGVRMALGADRGEVRRMVLRQGLGIALAGLSIGVAGALASGRALSGLLYGVSPYNPVLLLVAGTVPLLVAALVAKLQEAWDAEPEEEVVQLRHLGITLSDTEFAGAWQNQSGPAAQFAPYDLEE